MNDGHMVLVPCGLIAAACAAIEHKHESAKLLTELRRYTTGDLSREPSPQEFWYCFDDGELYGPHQAKVLGLDLSACMRLFAASPSGKVEPLGVIEQHPDDAAVDDFAAAMKEKLAQARAKGRGGWQTCPPEELSRMLREHVEKGDPRDVANFCMFLWHLGAGVAPAQQAQAEVVPTIYVSKGQLDNLKPDPEDTSGTYLPVRKSPKGKFTHPLFAAPKQAEPFSHATQLQIAYIKGLGDGAQQAQRPEFQDEWTGYLKDGETPFERFMRERRDLTSLTKLYQRVLEENEQLKAQQAQAEAVSDDLRDRLVAISAAIADQDDRAAQAMIREILAAPQQAEVAPAGWLNAPAGYAPTFLHQPQPPAPLTKQEALIAGWTPLFKEAPQQAVLAKRVPMPQSDLIRMSQDYADIEDEETAFRDGWRRAEIHHGIVGEKGGA